MASYFWVSIRGMVGSDLSLRRNTQGSNDYHDIFSDVIISYSRYSICCQSRSIFLIMPSLLRSPITLVGLVTRKLVKAHTP